MKIAARSEKSGVATILSGTVTIMSPPRTLPYMKAKVVVAKIPMIKAPACFLATSAPVNISPKINTIIGWS